MRLPDLSALLDWWRKNPPMAYSGGGEETRKKNSGGLPGDNEVLNEDGLMALLGPAAGPAKKG
jgi:hypothetical protein